MRKRQRLAPVAALLLTGIILAGLASSTLAADEPVGSVGYLLSYAKKNYAAGNLSGAASYAKEVLALDPGNAEARALLGATQAQSATGGAPGRGKLGETDTIGTAVYFLKYARHHLQSGEGAGAAKYAREALKVEPANREAQRNLAAAKRLPTPIPSDLSASGTARCDALYVTCYAGSMRYTPSSGYSADNPARLQCMVQRNICYGQN